jgi:transposase
MVVQYIAKEKERMLEVSQQEYIKFLRESEDLNISQIKGIMKIDWKTAKKYADKDDWNEPIKRKEKYSPVMGPYIEIVDTWLEEDRLVPRKQRHTAKAIYNRLCNEHNFQGGYRTVCSYVEKAKETMKIGRSPAFEKLEHDPGEAQVDFYTMKVSKDTELVDTKVLTLSYPYSNNAFLQPVPSENQECFLEGLKKLFEKSGGVPQSIWFDNLSAAVVKVEKGNKRILTDSFLRFKSHYGFKSIFCNPAAGNEKGNVENKCGYTRRNFCVPIPIFSSFENLEKELNKRAKEDNDRDHYIKDIPISDLWEEDKAKLKKLPNKEYEVYRLESRIVNKYGEVKVDDTNIRVFGVNIGTNLPIKISWDKIEVLSTKYEHITSIPRPYTDKKHEIPWVEVFKVYNKKPRSVTHSQFAKMLPKELREYISIENLDIRKERILACISWLNVYNIKDVSACIGQYKNINSISTITSALYDSSEHNGIYKNELLENYTPKDIRKSSLDLNIYNQLSYGGVRHE